MDEYVKSQLIELPLASAQEPDLKDLLRRIWRQKGLIAGTVILLVGITTVILTQLTALYTAEASILIEPRSDTLVKLSSLAEDPPTPEEAEKIQSEAEVLSSRDLAWEVIRRLNLEFEESSGFLGTTDRIFPATPPPVPLDSRLVAHLRFDESSGTVAADYSGNGRHGTYVGTPTHGEGRIRNAVHFKKATDYVQL
ncbi:MAG: Wzz/FepE/Etk N-terminal domain-containing protein, partial [Pyrinomonadaceae bacterium]